MASPPRRRPIGTRRCNELTLADAAYLATLPKAPSNYDPFQFPERAVARRNWVIDRMVENGFVTQRKAEKAKAEPLGVQVRHIGPKIEASEYFAEEVRREIIDLLRRGQALWRRPLGAHHARSAAPEHRAQGLVDGLVAYDHRHGWRGAGEARSSIAGDWGKTLAAMPMFGRYRPLAARRRARGEQGPGQDRLPPDAHLDRQAARLSARPASFPSRK